jgi:hypothetical protein
MGAASGKVMTMADKSPKKLIAKIDMSTSLYYCVYLPDFHGILDFGSSSVASPSKLSSKFVESQISN